MPPVTEIIGALRQAVPAGRDQLSTRDRSRLRRLTRRLIAANPLACQEHERYLALRQRAIEPPRTQLDAWLRGATVLVTGGTGCIGSALMRQLAEHSPGRLVSVSRGVTDSWPRIAGAQYRFADIRDSGGLGRVFDQVRPDVVFNVAAQRDPGLAEQQVLRTVSTAITGVRNVLDAAERAGVGHLVHASTGKALRPYCGDVYAASKRAAECFLAARAAETTIRLSAARFTHVVDNSIIYRRLTDWAAGGVVRLHDADTVFYGQSALESAQLLMCAGLAARRGTLRLAALSDLGWPVSLLDLTVGLLASAGSRSPIYISGHGPGYESTPFPALYDPLTAGEVSPLFNMFEAAGSAKAFGGAIDVCPLELAPEQAAETGTRALDGLLAYAAGPAAIRQALDELSWSLLDSTLRAVAPGLLRRASTLAAQHEGELSPAYRRMLAVVRRHADTASLVMA